MSTESNTNTQQVEKTQKKSYESRFSTEYSDIYAAFKSMDENYFNSKKLILLKLRELQSKVQKLEKESDKHEKRQNNRKKTAGPAQSFVGINQPKRIHPELLKFLESHKQKIREEIRDSVKTFMSLNEVTRCILDLAKGYNVVTETTNNNYNFRNDNADPTYVAGLRRLLVDLCPADYYKNDKGESTVIQFDSLIPTRKMSGYFNHLLTVDAESEAYKQQRIADKIANTAATVDTTTTTASVPSTPVVDTTPVVDEQPAAKKPRVIKRKTAGTETPAN